MATSERILTTRVSAADIQRHALYPSFGARPAWRQAVVDFTLISLGLIAVPALFGASFTGRTTHAYLVAQIPAPYLLALIITTIFGFAGAYPRRLSPLDIAHTEGLVRGVICGGIVLSIACLGSGAILDECAVATAGFIVTSLVIQRELSHTFRRPDRRPASLSSQLPFASTLLRMGSRMVEPEYVPVAGVSYAECSAGRLLKRGVDLVLATSLLILVTPLFLLVAIFIKIDSPGTVLIRQRRIGLNGRPFFMWKFRSMHAAVDLYAHSPDSEADPRLTRFGRSLRRFSIDELPQLFNVLMGDMSLVGPRPEMPFVVNKYQANERLRLNAIPGITGLWQISPARAMPIHENLEFDLFYIVHRNIFLDLAILLRTVTAVIRGIGAT